MKLLVFDTETSGLPKKGANFDNLNKYPYILQISYIFYDTSNENIVIKDHYIDVGDDVIISPESYKIHKITKQYLNENGKSIIYVLREFNEFVDKADIVIGHNINFDKNMITIECLRNNVVNKFITYKNNVKFNKLLYCTMYKSKNICKILKYDKNNKPYFKNPKLIELYQFLYPEKELPKDLHNSIVDVLLTFKCYMKIVHDSDIINNKISLLETKYGI